MLPVVAGLLLISILFQSLNSNFLTAGNLVNLLVQGAVFMLLAMGEVFALLLGEIDLSIGFVSGIGGDRHRRAREAVGTAGRGGRRSSPRCVACAAIGALQGTIITRLGLPSFVVTLAGLLGWQGVMLLILGQGGSLPINDNIINDIASGNLTPRGRLDRHDRRSSALFGAAVVASRRPAPARSGLVAPPASLTL